MKQFILFFLVLLPVCAFAQFTETFDGPEVNSANPWSGNLDKFIIDKDGWLHLNGVENEAGKVGLHCTIPYASTMQWEFDVRMEEVPSESNYLRLYLYMEDDGTYYYVQIGHTGAKKISLRTNNKQILFPLKESAITEKPVLLHIKATLENNNIWTLYSRRQGESCYRLEGSTIKFPVKAPQESGELTLNIEYTKTRYQHFAIDNIKVSVIPNLIFLSRMNRISRPVLKLLNGFPVQSITKSPTIWINRDIVAVHLFSTRSGNV